MMTPLVRSRALGLAGALALLAAAAAAPWGAAPAHAQSLLDRPPNMGGTWVGPAGTVHFHFNHRFRMTSAPVRKVLNSPTFLLAAGLPGGILAGARYTSNSTLVERFPNEWEFFTRVNPMSQADGRVADLSVSGGYNQAAQSFDGELALARRFGPVRVLGAVRGFSDAFRQGDARGAIVGGATVRLTRSLALAADVATLLDAADGERTAWSAGVQIEIPTTPHSLSLQATNAATTTSQGASIGRERTRWGFEFTVPITLSRYIGALRTPPPAPAGEQEAVSGAALEVTMNNRLQFVSDTVRIRVGETVRWRNASDLPHTVTADPELAMDPANVRLPEGAETFDSGDLMPGAVFTYTFDVPGEYKYVCLPHEAAQMVGWVIVEE